MRSPDIGSVRLDGSFCAEALLGVWAVRLETLLARGATWVTRRMLVESDAPALPSCKLVPGIPDCDRLWSVAGFGSNKQRPEPHVVYRVEQSFHQTSLECPDALPISDVACAQAPAVLALEAWKVAYRLPASVPLELWTRCLQGGTRVSRARRGRCFRCRLRLIPDGATVGRALEPIAAVCKGGVCLRFCRGTGT